MMSALKGLRKIGIVIFAGALMLTIIGSPFAVMILQLEDIITLLEQKK